MSKLLNDKHLGFLWLFVASSILATSPALATGGEEQVPTGPRPLSMGGAFTALSSGVDALTWNPAGLASLPFSTIRATHADLHGLGIEDNVVGLAVPVFHRFGVGLEWYRSGYSDDVFTDDLHRFTLGAGVRLLDTLTVGSAIRYRRYGQSFGGEDRGTGAGFGLDAGVMWSPWRRAYLGLTVHDVGDADLDYDDGTSSTPYGQRTTLGLAYEALDGWTFAMDLGRDLHLGTEVQVVDALTLRAGWTRDRDDLEGARISGGFGVRLGPTVLEYAFVDHPALDPTHHVGLSVDFSLAPRLLHVRVAELDPLFASFSKSYARRPAGALIVENDHDEPLEITVRLEHARWMPDASEETILLRPGVAQRVPLRPLLADAVLDVLEPTPVDFGLSIRYVSSGRTRTEHRSVRTTLYEPGTLTWGEGVERAAAFVTPSHVTLQTFVRNLLDARAVEGIGFLNRTATTAALLFDGLSALGFEYTPDPLNPFSTVQGDPVAVDDIQYPVELLQSRRGDCDDTTVLYASLLESVGIRSALVDVPGHVFVLFDTGLPARERRLTGYDPELYVERSGSLWIPVETTSLGQPFHTAWSQGAELLRRWEDAGRMTIVDLLEARTEYEAAVYGAPGDDAEIRIAVDTDAVRTLHVADMSELERRREEFLSAGTSHDGPTARESLALARVFFLNQDYARAVVELSAIDADARDATVWNNLGAAHLAGAQIDAAIGTLERARSLDGDDPGITLNLGLAFVLDGRVRDGHRALAAAARRSGGVGPAMELLGALDAPPTAQSRASAEASLESLSRSNIEALMNAALAAVPETEVGAADSTAAATSDSLRTVDDAPEEIPPEDTVERIIAAGHRGDRITPDTVGSLLYWRSPQTGKMTP